MRIAFREQGRRNHGGRLSPVSVLEHPYLAPDLRQLFLELKHRFGRVPLPLDDPVQENELFLVPAPSSARACNIPEHVNLLLSNIALGRESLLLGTKQLQTSSVLAALWTRRAFEALVAGNVKYTGVGSESMNARGARLEEVRDASDLYHVSTGLWRKSEKPEALLRKEAQTHLELDSEGPCELRDRGPKDRHRLEGTFRGI